MPQIVLVGSTQNLADSEYSVGPLPTTSWKWCQMFASGLGMLFHFSRRFCLHVPWNENDVPREIGAVREHSCRTRLPWVVQHVAVSQQCPGFWLDVETSPHFMRGHTLHFAECPCHTHKGESVVNVPSVWNSTWTQNHLKSFKGGCVLSTPSHLS